MAVVQSGNRFLRIPHNFLPRDYQIPFYNCIQDGYKRAVCVWHRRAGKDKVALNLLIAQAYLNPGTYYILFPTYNQARKILWDGMDSSGFKFMEHIPREIIALNDDGRVGVNNTEMKIKINTQKEGYTSLIQLIGTDNYDQIMGTNPIGCVFSEYSLQNPKAWDFIRPILAENGGWAAFIYTPRGRNHGWDIYQAATENRNWFCQLLTVEDTARPDGSPVISKEDIESERKSGMSDDMVSQEFYCDFDIGSHGAIFGKYMSTARKEGRISNIPFDSNLPVHTAWDLGWHGDTAIWFFQVAGKEVRLLRYAHDHNKELPYYAFLIQKIQQEEIKAGRIWRYGQHFAPHDARVHSLSTGITRAQMVREVGIDLTILPRIGVEAGIEYAKWMLPMCYFDAIGCPDGIKCLEMYQRDWDDEKKVFKDNPKRNWASHGADAFRMIAIAVRRGLTEQVNVEEAIAMYQKLGPPSVRMHNAHTF